MLKIEKKLTMNKTPVFIILKHCISYFNKINTQNFNVCVTKEKYLHLLVSVDYKSFKLQQSKVSSFYF